MKWQLQWRHWSYYRQLMRLDKPVGIYLLLWPTWWALWLAAEGMPAWTLWLVFTLGVILMRSAGCVINDYADRQLDGAVSRTRCRPLAAGHVTSAEALQLFVLLIILAATLWFWLNWQTIALSFIAVALAASYPFMKRYTHLPQVVLGAAFSWSMPMAFMAIQLQLPAMMWWLYLANLCWTVAYDTYYAMVDQPDDENIGIKSTAILFGRHGFSVILCLQAITILLLAYVGYLAVLGWWFRLALLVSCGLFVYQYLLARNSRQQCFQAFLHNHYVGLVVFFGMAMDYGFSG